ncbi:peptidase M56, BlaR1 [Clostridium saccharobutylicum]|nr:peptidase M56, BlaR1 [Clostridium saccharobutylicum]
MKNFKKDSRKISKKAILSCVVIASMVATNTSMVKAAEINNGMATVSSSNEETTNGKHNFIIDEPSKYYDDIKKVEEVAGFKFKVPDFVPAGNSLECFHMRKLSNNDNGIQILFNNSNSKVSGIKFYALKKDPVNGLKEIEVSKMNSSKDQQVDVEEQTMKLGEINGTSLTMSITRPSEKLSNGLVVGEFKETNKYFIWENDGLYYCISYNLVTKSEDKDSKERLNLSEDTIEKISESIKYPEEVKNVDYSVPNRELSTEVGVMNIYDNEDLEKAKSLLGFNPKLPLKINDDISINDSVVGISGDSDIENNKINYELNSFYSNSNGSITFNASKSSKEYDDIEKNGYFNRENWKTKELMQVKAEKLNISNKEVLKYEEKGIEPEQGSDVSYLWKEDGVYYDVIFFKNIENSDEIIKNFINSKCID